MIESHNSLQEKFFKKWIWLYLFSFVIAPTGYIIKIILTNDITPSEIWIIYWVMSLMVLLSAFNDFWMKESLNKFIPEYVNKNDYSKVKSVLLIAMLTQIITWTIIFTLFFFWASFLWNSYFWDSGSIEVIKVFAFFFLWINVFQVLNSFFGAVQNTFMQKFSEFFRMIFVLWMTFVLFFTDTWSVLNYSMSWIVGLFAWVILSVVYFYFKYYHTYLKWVSLSIDKAFLKKIFSYWVIVFLWAQAWNLLSQVDMQMVIYMLWTTDAWYYSIYLSLIWIPFLVIGPIFGFLFPVFSDLYSKNKLEDIKKVKYSFQKHFLVIWIAFNVFLFTLANSIAYSLFWGDYIISWDILKYSVLLLMFNFLLQVNFHIFASTWRVKERLYIILSALLLNFVLNIVFIWLMWVAWAALATWIGWIFIWLLCEWRLSEYRVWFDFIFILKNISLILAMWLFLFLVVNSFILGLDRFYWFLVLGIVWAVYFLIFMIFNKSEIIKFIKQIKTLKGK